jgi:deoxyadenosine/deoxycytidine kinase
MKVDFPEKARILILEGVSGSGKTTLKGYLKDHLKNRTVYEYIEDDLLLGWKHIHIPHLSVIRVNYFFVLLDYLEKKLKEEPDCLILLERFHLSVKVLEWEFENNFSDKYQDLLSRLQKLPAHILIAKLKPFEIKKRMMHRERTAQWDQFVKEKLALRGYTDLEQLSIEQQEAFFNTAAEQGISYSAIHVEIDK